MLDAYIIERIRRERDVQDEHGKLVPLRIDVPRPKRERDPADDHPAPREDETGSAIVDFQL